MPASREKRAESITAGCFAIAQAHQDRGNAAFDNVSIDQLEVMDDAIWEIIDQMGGISLGEES